MAKERATTMNKESQKPMNSWIFRCFFKTKYFLLLRDKPLISDLGSLNKEYQWKFLKGKISDKVNHILQNKQIYSAKFKKVQSVFGFYDFIIKSLTFYDRLILYLLELLFGLSYFAMYYCAYSVLARLDYLLLSGVDGRIASAMVCGMCAYVGYICLDALLQQQERVIYVKAKQCLSILTFEKLAVSDKFFLKNADNNMIHKLMYAEQEDYARMVSFPIGLFSQIAVLSLFVCIAVSENSKSLYTCAILSFIRILASLLLEMFRSGNIRKYKMIVFEKRKMLYEFIRNFKSFKLRNFKMHSYNFASDLNKLKFQSLWRFNLSSHIEHTINIVFTSLILLAFSFERVMRIKQQSQINHSENGQALFSIFVIKIWQYTQFMIDRFSEQVLQASNHRSSREVLDKFFDNDFVVANDSQAFEGQQVGSIQIDDCEVVKRDQSDILRTINLILHKKEEEKFNVGRKLKKMNSVNPHYGRKKPDPLKNQLLHRWHTLAKDSSIKHDGHDTPAAVLTRVFAGASISIPAGCKACIYDCGSSGERSQYLVSLLLGECLVKSGDAFVAGVVSYFNPKEMPFLMGKTIRENILFSESFNSEKYERVLKSLEKPFNNYRGQDFYEVAERGCNLKAEDKNLLLLARFLYQEASIYIIDGYFSNSTLPMTSNQIKLMFASHLAKKTVILISTSLKIVKLSDIVIKFSNKNKLKTIDAKVFLRREENLRSNMSYDKTLNQVGLDTQTSRYAGIQREVLRNKHKNAVFLENISYDEELAIQKKQDKINKQIGKVIGNNADIYDQIAYGIYLTNKRRQEGKYLDASAEINLAELKFAMCSMFHDVLGWKKTCLLLVVYTTIGVLLLTAEYLLITYAYTRSLASSHELDMLSRMCEAIFIIVIIAQIARSIILGKILKKWLQEINKLVLNSLFDSGYAAIVNKKSHALLGNTSIHLVKIETMLLDVMHYTIDNSVNICLSLCLNMYILSVLSALIITAVFLIALIWLFNRLAPSYLRLLTLSDRITSMDDDFNYQLLDLIESFRIKASIDILRDKRASLADSLTKDYTARKQNFTIMLITIFMMFSIVICAIAYALIALIMYVPSLNLFDVGFVHLIYGGFLVTRIGLILNDVPKHIGFLEILVPVYKIWKFNQTQKNFRIIQNHKPEWMLGRRITYNEAGSLRFKNVSLTVGPQSILKQISFQVLSGGRVSIVGIEGSGKSTIFELITKILSRDTHNNSYIKMFGLRIEDITEEQLESLVYMLERDPALLEGSMRLNIDPYFKLTDNDIFSLLNAFNFDKICMKSLSNMRKNRLDSGTTNDSPNKPSVFESQTVGESVFSPQRLRSSSFCSDFNKDLPSPRVAKPSTAGMKDAIQYPSPMISNNSSAVQPRLKVSRFESGHTFNIPQISISNLLVGSSIALPLSPVASSFDPDNSTPKDFDSGKPRVGLDLPFSGNGGRRYDQYMYSGEKASIEDIKINVNELNFKIGSLESSDSDGDDEQYNQQVVYNFNEIMTKMPGSGHSKNKGKNDTLCKFIESSSAFEGKNIDIGLRKLVAVCRLITSDPKLVLIYEEALNFGNGVEKNLKKLYEKLPKSTILCISKPSMTLLSFYKLIFIDGGKIIEQGNPTELLHNKTSYLRQFIYNYDSNLLSNIDSVMAFQNMRKSSIRRNSRIMIMDQSSDEDQPRMTGSNNNMGEPYKMKLLKRPDIDTHVSQANSKPSSKLLNASYKPTSTESPKLKSIMTKAIL